MIFQTLKNKHILSNGEIHQFASEPSSIQRLCQVHISAGALEPPEAISSISSFTACEFEI
jgi:hypothetical protein